MRKDINMKKLLKEMNETSKLFKNTLFEDYMGSQDPQQMDNQEMMPQDEGMMGNEEMGMEEPQVNEQTVDTINQIRELAIQGIAQYANDVESEEYQALKKIWLLTDKFYEGMQEDENEKGKKF